MFGYILAFGLALLLALLGLVLFSRSGPQSGRRQPDAGSRPPEHPAADEPTPDQSSTASAGEVAAARRHTPPA
jgi:hypothetical protein